MRASDHRQEEEGTCREGRPAVRIGSRALCVAMATTKSPACSCVSSWRSSNWRLFFCFLAGSPSCPHHQLHLFCPRGPLSRLLPATDPDAFPHSVGYQGSRPLQHACHFASLHGGVGDHRQHKDGCCTRKVFGHASVDYCKEEDEYAANVRGKDILSPVWLVSGVVGMGGGWRPERECAPVAVKGFPVLLRGAIAARRAFI